MQPWHFAGIEREIRARRREIPACGRHASTALPFVPQGKRDDSAAGPKFDCAGSHGYTRRSSSRPLLTAASSRPLLTAASSRPLLTAASWYGVLFQGRRSPRRQTNMGVIDNRFERSYVLSTVDYVFNWARKSAIWPLTFGLACCAIEMIASTTSRFDIARFGAEVFRPSPRQADLMIVAGTVTLKMSPVLKRVWEQMPDPKWCISMGACSSVGGPFNVYSVLQGVDRIVPVDVYVIGCPPRPEGLFYALLKLQDKIDTMTLAKRPTEVRLEPRMVEEFKRGVMVAQTPEPR